MDWIYILDEVPQYYHPVEVKTEDGEETIAWRSSDGENESYTVWNSNRVLISDVIQWREHEVVQQLETYLKTLT